MSNTEKRIIVIGSEGHHGVKTAPWDAKEMPNIADYDNVILETSSLASLLKRADSMPKKQREESFDRIYENLKDIQNRLLHILHSQGNIYALCSPRVIIKYGTTPWGYIDNYDWSPLPILLVEESGDTIELSDDSFAHYFQFVNKWSLCFEELEPGYSYKEHVSDFYKGKYYVNLEMEVIAENRYTRPIAISLSYALHERVEISETHKALASVYGWKTPKHKSETEHISGKIILLPPPTEIDIREAINLLLEDFWGIQQKTPPPEGIDKILLPGEDSIKQEIEHRNIKIQSLTTEISNLEKREEELTQFKQLLYETGDPLEDICKLTLSQLGCAVDDSFEDFILVKGDKEGIVEVKGRERTILREDGAMLAQNRSNYAIQKGKGIREIKAILLGNPWRLVLPIEERGKKEPFSSHLVEDAKVGDMALVTTVELFKAYCAFLEGKISDEEIIQRLFSAIGPTTLLEE